MSTAQKQKLSIIGSMLYIGVVFTINICCSSGDWSHKVTGQSFIKWCPLKQFILHMLKKWLNQQPTLPASYMAIYSQLSLLQVGWSCGNLLVHTPEQNMRQFDKSQRNNGVQCGCIQKNVYNYNIYLYTYNIPPS